MSSKTARAVSALALSIALALGAAARGQTAAPAAAADTPPSQAFVPWVLGEDIVVTARQPGPALWRLKRGDAEVLMVGVPPLDFRGEHWDLRRVDRFMNGASVLYVHRTGVRMSTDNPFMLFKAPGWLARMHLARGRAISDVVGPDLWVRYQGLSRRLGVTGRMDETLKPFFFADAFKSAAYRQAALDADASADAIVQLAKGHQVKVRYVDSFKIDKGLEELLDLSDNDGRACFAEVLDETAFNAAHGREASEAWAGGDLATVRANTISLTQDCLARLPTLSRDIDQNTTEIAGLVETALTRPGKTVFVLPLETLLKHQGVLERVHGEGVEVTSPAL
jgi:hypothetical protein